MWQIDMKPRTPVVMSNIIRQVRAAFPFEMTEQELCAETCSYGCPKKLLEYIDMELTDWEQRLVKGEIPSFGDIQKLTKTSKNIYRVLKKNNIVNTDE
jgi:hypothetical protein